MKIGDILSLKTIIMDLKASKKEMILDEMLEKLIEAKKIEKRNKYRIKKTLMERETMGSTGIGHGIAIPHAKDNHIKKITCCCAISHQGVNFDSLDGEPVYVLFMLISPANATGFHLKTLARISRLVKDRIFREALLNCKSAQAILKLIRKEEEELN
jgi:fructose-specific phosphotransferase system IIA component